MLPPLGVIASSMCAVHPIVFDADVPMIASTPVVLSTVSLNRFAFVLESPWFDGIGLLFTPSIVGLSGSVCGKCNRPVAGGLLDLLLEKVNFCC